jgi:transposase
MWRDLSSGPRLAHPAAVGLELSASRRAGAGAERREDPAVEAEALARVKKKAKNEGRTIVFIDESGLSERPHRCRTWAPRGQTPLLQYHFNWKTLSAIAGVTWWNFYFRLFPGTIRSPQIILFLSHLLRHIRGKLLIIWDGLPGHHSGAVWDFVREQKGRLWLEFLPAYAPELNPVEYLWAHWKQHQLPNFCPQTFGQLSTHARRALRRMRRRPTLVCAFWEQAELFPL